MGGKTCGVINSCCPLAEWKSTKLEADIFFFTKFNYKITLSTSFVIIYDEADEVRDVTVV